MHATLFVLLPLFAKSFPKEGIKCLNIESYSKEEKEKLLKRNEEHASPSKILYFIERGPKHAMSDTYYNNGTHFDVLRYDLSDEIIKNQFFFHLKLFKDPRMTKILPQNLNCMIDGKWGYLMNHNMNDFHFFDFRIRHFSSLEINTIILSIAEMLRIFEICGAMVVEKECHGLIYSKGFMIRPNLGYLIYLYPRNKPFYKRVESVPTVEVFEKVRTEFFTNSQGIYFLVGRARLRVHRYSVLKILRFYLWRSMLDRLPEYKTNLHNLDKNIWKYEYMMVTTPHKSYRWSRLIKLFREMREIELKDIKEKGPSYQYPKVVTFENKPFRSVLEYMI